MKDKSLAQLIDQYLIWLSASKSKDTVAGFKTGLRRFSRWMKKSELELFSLTPVNIGKYYQYLNEEKLSRRTQSVYVCALRNFWQWISKQTDVPFDVDMIPVITVDRNSIKEVASQEDYKKIISVFDDFFPKDNRDRALIAFLYATGVRVSEMINLELRDFDCENKCALVKTFKRKNHYRRVYWTAEEHQFIHAWFSVRDKLLSKMNVNSTALFFSITTNNYGSHLDRTSVARIVRNARKRAGISRQITAHSFRHGFATRAVKRDANMRYLQEMMGHAKLDTTMIYARAEKEEVEQEYRRLFG